MRVIDANTPLTINRNNLYYDAYSNIMKKSPYDLKKRLHIHYLGEKGIDAGGLLR